MYHSTNIYIPLQCMLNLSPTSECLRWLKVDVLPLISYIWGFPDVHAHCSFAILSWNKIRGVDQNAWILMPKILVNEWEGATARFILTICIFLSRMYPFLCSIAQFLDKICPIFKGRLTPTVFAHCQAFYCPVIICFLLHSVS